jgi:hypothetical protein
MKRRTALVVPVVLASQLAHAADKAKKTSKIPAETLMKAKKTLDAAAAKAPSLPADQQALYERHLLGLVILCFNKQILQTVWSKEYDDLDQTDPLRTSNKDVYNYLHANLVEDTNFYKAFQPPKPFPSVAPLFERVSNKLTALFYDPDNPCPSRKTGLWLLG